MLLKGKQFLFHFVAPIWYQLKICIQITQHEMKVTNRTSFLHVNRNWLIDFCFKTANNQYFNYIYGRNKFKNHTERGWDNELDSWIT